jgi:hypothetical protein
MACSCESSTVVRSCAPYANVNDVNNLLSAICPNCAAVVPAGTSSSNFCSLGFDGAMDDCCEYLVVFEGTNIWFSVDCSLWIMLTGATSTKWEVGDLKPSSRISDSTNVWLRSDGRTVGNGVSGATARANTDMLTLFTHLWDEFSNTELVIQDSSGTPTARGASAAADWSANKRMPLPDLRGRTIAGMDDPTGADAADRITDAGADILGDNVGSEEHILTTSEMPIHTHTARAKDGGTLNSTLWLESGDATTATIADAGMINNAGGGLGHANIQPTYFLNYFIYTGN